MKAFSKRTFFFWLLLLFFLIDWLLVATHNSFVLNSDHTIRELVNLYRTRNLTFFFSNLTKLFNSTPSIIWALAIGISLVLTQRFKFTILYCLIVLSGTLLNKVIKHIVLRPRPQSDVLIHYAGYSFPSGHSSGVVLIIGSTLLFLWASHQSKQLKIFETSLIIALILLIGFSRIYVGAHYPSDVLGGWCLGAIVILFWQNIFQRFKK
ncbi:phosphatase PAP2 family protein [Lactobacillus sp. 3B(2020)]|uniref:phosphatase PAP2 family protein n=1 Tax=Lactobacillus sp. 3B(2020) TaxID=2695882 RepID=UPI0015DE652F|nr:phosphatase PAP2 family protein [Lactobacillus sp. 3B(2020)]QLL69635.1 phosphatase PAP2 family protein [Lactobacillus sp. 3B(2020)]